jgi:hypothetical protein
MSALVSRAVMGASRWLAAKMDGGVTMSAAKTAQMMGLMRFME